MKNKLNIFAGYSEFKTHKALNWEKNRSKEYREYRKNWEENPKNLKIPDFPMHLDIEATSNCNLMCPMCARTQKVKEGTWRKNQHLDFELFKKIIDEGSREGLCAINLNNFGEPLLNPKLSDMIKYAKSNSIIDVFFHTNGVLLTKDFGKKLIEAGLDRIIFSFDSPYKEKYEKIRVGAIYENVLRNIRDLYELREKLKSQIPLIRINMIKFPDLTEKELEDMKREFLEIADSIGFLDLVCYSDNNKKINFPKNYISKFICPQIISRLTILEDGTVLPCCKYPEPVLTLGNVKEKSLKELWKGKKLANIRKKHFEGKFFDISACRNCDFAIKEDKRAR